MATRPSLPVTTNPFGRITRSAFLGWVCASIILFALTATSASAQDYEQIGQTIEGESVEGQFGNAVSLSSDGMVVAVGAYQNDVKGESTGHVRVYEWDADLGFWVQRGVDIDGEAAGDNSGWSASLSPEGLTVAIGAPGNAGNGDFSGHVRVFDWNGTAWLQRGADLDGEAIDDNSGYSVSLSSDGQFVAIGAPNSGVDSGQVRIYEWGGSEWIQRGIDIDGEAEEDESGGSVSLSSDGLTVAIGARGNAGNGVESGHVRVYVWNGSAWIQRGGDLDGEAAGDDSGYSVALSSDGQVVAIGAPANVGSGTEADPSGHVRVYEWDESDEDWFQRGADIDGEEEADASGQSVSVSSDGLVVAIGATRNDGNGEDSGHVRVYDFDAEDDTIWIQRGVDIDGDDSDDQAGYSVSLSSDGAVVAVGSPKNNNNGEASGHARVFEFTQARFTNYEQLGLDLDGEVQEDGFGYSVSLSSDGLVVAVGPYANDDFGANAVQVFAWNGSAWIQRGMDIDGEAEDNSGWNVSLSADGLVLAIGTWSNDGNGDNSGHVRVYSWNGTAWNQQGADIDGEAAQDGSGHSVALSSDGLTVAIGARGNAGNGVESGHVRVYTWNGSAWIKRGADLDGEAAGDDSGYSVALSSDGQVVAIGAPANTGSGTEFDPSGHVRVYAWSGRDWIQRGIDLDGELEGEEGVGSGESVSLSSDGLVLAIGAPRNGSGSGHVRVFVWDESDWIQRGADIDGEEEGDGSGTSVSLSSNGLVVAIGAPDNSGIEEGSGHVRVYDWDEAEAEWILRESEIEGESESDNSGESVSLSSDGRIVAIGAKNNDGNGNASGHVRVFEFALGSDPNEDPSATGIPADLSFTEDVESQMDLSSMTLADMDAGDGSVTLTLSASSGTLAASTAGGVTVGGSDTSTLTLDGTVSTINTFLDTASNVQYTGALNDYGEDAATLTLTANDGGNTGDGGGDDVELGTVNLDIAGVADTPSVTDAATDEDIQTTEGLVFSRHASDGAEATHFKITSISGGALFKNDGATKISSGAFVTFAEGNAGLRFTPTENSTTDGSFAAQASTAANDGGLGGSTATATITVNAVNDPPRIASAAAVEVDENTTAVMTVTFTDPDPVDPDPADDHTFSITGGADEALFLVDASTGALAFSTAPNFEAPSDAGADNIYDVQVTVTEVVSACKSCFAATALSDAIDIAVTVIDVNDAPVISSASATNAAENQTSVMTVTATDEDNLGFAMTGGADAAFFSIDQDTGVLSFLAAPDFENPADAGDDNVYDLIVTVTDDGSGTLTDAVSIAVTVTNVNEAPVLTVPGPQATTEDTAITFSVAGMNPISVADVDAGGSDLTMTLTATSTVDLADLTGLTIGGGADGSSVVTISGTVAAINNALDGLVYTPSPDQLTGASLTIEVSDGGASGPGGVLTDSETITINIISVNDFPEATPMSVTTEEDAAVTITILAGDSDGDALTVSLASGPISGSAKVNPDGTITYTPAANFFGEDRFEYTVTDASGASDSETVSINVGAVNDPPVAVDDVVETNQDVAVVIAVLTNDSDVESDVSISAVGTPGNGAAVNNDDGSITYTPTDGFSGVDTFTYMVSDGELTSEASVTVSVSGPGNDGDGVGESIEDGAPNDGDGNNDGTIDRDQSNVSSLPIGVGPHTGQYVTIGVPAGQAFTKVQSGVNPSPGDYPADASSPVGYLTYTISRVPETGTMVIINYPLSAVVTAYLKYGPTPDNPAPHWYNFAFDGRTGAIIRPGQIQLYFQDGERGDTDLTQNGIVVDPGTPVFLEVNAAPMAGADTAATEEDSALQIDVLANDTDADGDALSAMLELAPEHGTAILEGNTFTYVPEKDFFGQDSFTYVAHDPDGAASVATVSITITPVQDAPVAVDDEASTMENTPVTFSLFANDFDVDGDVFWLSSQDDAQHGVSVYNKDGTVTYTPAPGYFGTDSWVYTITDGMGASGVIVFGSITMTVVDDPNTTSREGNLELPTEIYLDQNYPNPFNPSTSVEFGLPEAGMVRLEVFDVVGRLVQVLVSEFLPAGRHTRRLQMGDVPSGVYLYRLTAGGRSYTRTLQLVK